MIVHCSHDALVPIRDLQPHPRNRNRHPIEQIKALAKILEYQGFRSPIKVSKLSGCVTAGHGRIEAARELGWTEVPVNFQDYDSEEQEYADLIADNTIAEWSILDFKGLNADLEELGPDFALDMLGIKNFVLDPSELTPKPKVEKEEGLTFIERPHCEESFELGQALIPGESTLG